MSEGLNDYWVDLHVHTVLSPCAELEMGARGIVERAREARVDALAISDHNTCDNVRAIENLARGNPIILPALEIQSAEDIHAVTIFPRIEEAENFKEWLWKKMPPVKNDPDVFGYQVVIDSNDDIVRMEDILLVQGAGYDIDTIVARANIMGAITIMAHADRHAFAYPAVLGTMPEDYPVGAIELSRRVDSDEASLWRAKYPSRTFLRSSDSHTLDTISRSNCTKMRMSRPSFDEIVMALRGKNMRRVYWPWG